MENKNIPIELTEREAKQLLKLLDKFSKAPKAAIAQRERHILDSVTKWVKWYTEDELGVEV